MLSLLTNITCSARNILYIWWRHHGSKENATMLRQPNNTADHSNNNTQRKFKNDIAAMLLYEDTIHRRWCN